MPVKPDDMGSCYVLPDGNVQIAFSGGRTSGYLLRQILDANAGIPSRAVLNRALSPCWVAIVICAPHWQHEQRACSSPRIPLMA